MAIIAFIVIAIVVVSIIEYVHDCLTLGEYRVLMPSYGIYVRNMLTLPVDAIIKKALRNTRVRTPEGILYCPENRPRSFFREGEKVVFMNIRHHYPDGSDMGITITELPEGPVEGVVRQIDEGECGDDVVVMDFGDNEVKARAISPLVLHKWELAALRKRPFTRKLVYCADLQSSSIGGLDEAITKA